MEYEGKKKIMWPFKKKKLYLIEWKKVSCIDDEVYTSIVSGRNAAEAWKVVVSAHCGLQYVSLVSIEEIKGVKE